MLNLQKTDDLFEYLANHQKGSFLELQKITGWNQINLLKTAGFLDYDAGTNKYEFTQKGVDYYAENIYQEKEMRGIFKNLRKAFN